ncbi:MAG: hypothetical protein ABEH86_04710 [Haloarcula sp.]
MGEIRDAGTRILRVGAREPFYLRKLMPWTEKEAQEVKDKVQKHSELLANTDKMRITSEYGTDITISVSSETAFDSYGFVDEPGKWDVWEQNMVSNYPTDVEGTIVISRVITTSSRSLTTSTPLLNALSKTTTSLKSTAKAVTLS